MTYSNMDNVPTQTAGTSELLASDWNTYVRDNFDSIKFGHVVCTSSTRPTGIGEGTMIYETDTNKGLVYTGSAWVEIFDLDYSPGYSVCTSSTRPTAFGEGQIIYETDTNYIMVYDGTDWINCTGLPIVTTTQRGRLTATTGLEVYNTTVGAFEWYNGTGWAISRPYAMTAGSVYGGATTQVDTVTYPTSRFSQSPILHIMTPANNQLPTTSAQSSTSFTWDNNPNNVNLTMHWIAIQMKSGAAGE